MSTVLTGNALSRFQLCALKSAVKLEDKGMKRHGKSATMIVKQMFNLPVGTPRSQLIERLEQEIKEFV